MDPVPYKKALFIQFAERDFELGLDSESWPDSATVPPGWERGPGYLHREIAETEEEKKVEKQLNGPIKESILRFPSAPIHGLHRRHEYHFNERESENLHTYRVLTDPEKFTRVRRIFLLHNGLNETQSMGFYYRLASYLISQDPGGTACLLRPFPGHLSRSRFQRFAETPLDHYLWDGSNLFRQFLRYMIETQWLLSVIARRSSYRCISGFNLLAEHEDPEHSRLEDDLLGRAMSTAWLSLYRVSERETEDFHEEQSNATSLKEPLEDAPFIASITALRGLLQLDARLGGEFDPGQREEPTVHAIGYSLGGFTAQSVFMAWPFLVASCSTVLSGGALRELAPTAFADPEEWQTVLHSLRYELDDAMMSGRYSPAGEKVSGIELDLFLFLKKTFYEVFQQEYRGSFQTRLAAFRRRMLFVVGGNDPIVRPKSVLDSAPPDGINLLAIGGLGHFLEGKSRDDEENEQRSFWLPEMGRLMNGLAVDAANNQHRERTNTWLDSNMHYVGDSDQEVDGDQESGRLSVAERLAVEGDGALPGPLFQRCLDDLLARSAAGDGLLFILRNEVPTVLLDEDAIQEHAAALHHSDPGIVNYIDGLRKRYRIIHGNPDRICVVLPWNAGLIMRNMDARPGHPSQSEGGGQMPIRSKPEETWKAFRGICDELSAESRSGVIRIYDGRKGVDAGTPKLEMDALDEAARERLRTTDEDRKVTPSLPDCWVWMSREFLFPDDEEVADPPGEDDGLAPDPSGEGDGLDLELGRRRLCKVVPEHYLQGKQLADQLRKDQLRVVTVSRARYNPRFRGRIMADPKAVKDLLLHATLCIAGSVPYLEAPEFRAAA